MTSLVTNKGSFSAKTNVPPLSNTYYSGSFGDYFTVSEPGLIDFGSGAMELTVGAIIVYNGTFFERYSASESLGLDYLVDPNADRILYWNNTTNQLEWLTPGDNLEISSGTINHVGPLSVGQSPSITADTGGASTFIKSISIDANGHIKSVTTDILDNQTLNFAGDTGTGTIDLSSQTLTLDGINGISTVASSQTIQIGHSTTGGGTQTTAAYNYLSAITVDTWGHVTATARRAIAAGGGISLSTAGTTDTISHSDTSSQASVTSLAGNYISGITLDTYGHVTGISTRQVLTAGNHITVSGNTVNHASIGSGASTYATTGDFITGVTIDTYGHVTAVTSGDYSSAAPTLQEVTDASGATPTTTDSITIGDTLSLTRNVSRRALISVPATGGGNDPQGIVFDEGTLNSGYVWIFFSDDVDANAANDWFYVGDYNLTDWAMKLNGAGNMYVKDEIYANSVDRVFHDTYHPNADKWTTGRSFTVSVNGNSATQTGVDGTGNVSLAVTLPATDAINIGGVGRIPYVNGTEDNFDYGNLEYSGGVLIVTNGTNSITLNTNVPEIGFSTTGYLYSATSIVINAPTLSAQAISGTTGNFSSTLIVGDGIGNEGIYLNGSGERDFYFQKSGVNRWIIRNNSVTESGGNTGSDLQIIRRSDAGANIGTVLELNRATGNAVFSGSLTAGAISGTTGTFSGNIIVGATSTPFKNIVGTYSYPPTVSGIEISGNNNGRITVKGAVGAALDLIDSGAATNLKWIQIQNSDGTTYIRNLTDGGVSGTKFLEFNNSTGAATFSGNVGIGVAPSYRLDVYNASSDALIRARTGSSGSRSGIRFGHNTDSEGPEISFGNGTGYAGALNVILDTSYDLSVKSTALATPILFIDTSVTRVGINKSSPTYTFDVTGDIRATSKVYAGSNNNYMADNGGALSFYDNGVESLRVESARTYFRNGFMLYSTAITSSDRRLKSDIQRIGNARQKLLSISGYSYILNHTGENDYGLIAQEVSQVLPYAVQQQGDPFGKHGFDPLGLNYNAPIALLVEGFKDHDLIMSDHDRKIAALEQEIKELKLKLKEHGMA